MSKNTDSFMIHIQNHNTVQHSCDKSLLESLEMDNVEIHSHCRQGFCGTCRTKLLSGQVEYLCDPLAYIDDDEILPCCCRPLSDIEIAIE
jgi:ferredoxin